MRIYRITTRHSQLVDVSTPHSQSDISGVGFQMLNIFVIPYHQIIQGTWVFSTDYNQYFDIKIRNTSKTINDEIDYKILLAKGTYKAHLVYIKNSDGGICSIKIDDTEIMSVDMYASSTTRNQIATQSNINISSDGIKTLKFIAKDKNASSSGYFLEFSAFFLTRIS